ncbi:unnamed protein product [Periconia digitata]|uniref:Transmembrane protein n=1 Tax=Periconia digitata TaxID=1303443 RepID=A0A9W4XQX7_9PLEO|nr:unnamed protein product [Periconia digitata]
MQKVLPSLHPSLWISTCIDQSIPRSHAEITTYLLYPVIYLAFFFSYPLMPPLPLPSVPAENTRTTTASVFGNTYGGGYGPLFKIFLLVLVVVTGLRLAVTRFSTREHEGQHRSRNKIKRKETTNPYTSFDPCRKHARHKLASESTTSTAEESVYPWIAPPQPLPGPYDPPFYPLPTLRRHSYDPTVTKEKTPHAEAAEMTASSYTRRVSATNIPRSGAQTSQTAARVVVRGTVTNSSKGWRRNQWVVGGERD